jgi:hypothetical protein
MKRRELEDALLTLETTPLLLASLFRDVGPGDSRASEVAACIRGMTAFENGHWADRIRRMRDEEQPFLRAASPAAAPGGGADVASALEAFGRARAANVRRLRALTPRQWDRSAVLEMDGVFRLRDLPGAMARADRECLAQMTHAHPHATEADPEPVWTEGRPVARG